MKLSIKLVILISAVVLLLGATLYLFSLITKPPIAPNELTQFKEELDKEIEEINEDNRDNLLVAFKSVDNELEQWNKNNLISDECFDETLNSFIDIFVPTYTASTLDHLANHSWGSKEKHNIYDLVLYLRTKSNIRSSYKPAVSNNANAQKLNELEKICNSYDEACQLVANTNFVSLSNSNTRIKLASKCRDNIYLSNSDIYSDIRNFADNLGNSHLQYIRNLFSRLADWRYYSIRESEANLDLLKSSCSEYSGTSIYGENHPKSLGSMIDDAESYMKSAYNEKCYLTVNGNSSNFNYSLSSQSNSYTFNVSTDHPDGYNVTVPYFCTLENKSKNSFTVRASSSGTENRSGYYISVSSGNKSIHINLSQSASSGTVTIGSVNAEHNVYQNGEKGMKISLYYTSQNMSGKSINFTAWFYFKNGNILKDFNGKYKSPDGQVAVATNATPQSNAYNGYVYLFMPYNELHMNSGSYELKFDVGAFYNSKQIARSGYTYFNFNK